MRGLLPIDLACVRSAVDNRPRKRCRGARSALLTALCVASLVTGAAAEHPANDDAHPEAPARGVAAPNVRFGVHYDYLRQGKTSTYSALTASTLGIGHHEGHGARAELVGAIPLFGPIGLRAWVHGSIGHAQRSLDGLSRGNNELSILGTGGELIVRDAAVGELALGGGWDRIARDGPIDANAYHGRASLAIFYPDLGLGPVDWRVDLQFTHREVSDTGGVSDIDGDRYRVAGQAGWYVNPDLQIALGGRWDRAEDEFSSEVDAEGFVQVRAWLPRRFTFGVPIELNFGGSAGVSEFKQPPFRTDKRAVWGANAGLVFRFGAGETLLESVRAYD